MIAEKAADLILKNTPLAPANVEYYQHSSIPAAVSLPHAPVQEPGEALAAV